jgi:hypothetical protein
MKAKDHLRKNKVGLTTAYEAIHGVSDAYKISAAAHDNLHGPPPIIWTSKATLAVEDGTPIYFPRGGSITLIQANVTGAPSGGALTFDLELDGTSVFDSVMSIADGETRSRYKLVNRPDFNEDTKWQFAITAVSGATGPLVVTVEYTPGW